MPVNFIHWTKPKQETEGPKLFVSAVQPNINSTETNLDKSNYRTRSLIEGTISYYIILPLQPQSQIIQQLSDITAWFGKHSSIISEPKYITFTERL